MIFECGSLYHIYNQGNNRQRIFFNHENYLFFLKKLNRHILPHADILAWCLMPNHFHLMVHVNQVIVEVADDTDGVTERFTDGVTRSHPVSKPLSFNDNIGILLRSYSRAINKQEDRVGALFREETKAECITPMVGITPSFYNTPSGTIIPISNPEMEYPQICFDYIHFNPVAAHLVVYPEDWEFSSYRDYCGIRKGKLINRQKAEELGLTG